MNNSRNTLKNIAILQNKPEIILYTKIYSKQCPSMILDQQGKPNCTRNDSTVTYCTKPCPYVKRSY